MTDLRPEICLKLKDARRLAGISQSELAAELGCKQPALSMFEQGDGTKLNEEVILKYAKKFGIDLKATGEAVAVTATAAEPHTGYCPNPQCPSNHGYSVGGRTLYRPDREVADPVGGRYCAICGEILERRCPSCGAPIHPGAVCSFCGQPYVSARQH